MIHSMTGFGRSRKEGAAYAVSVEMRALNAKQLDISVRIPRNFIEFEDLCRKLISASIRRGRIDAFVQIDSYRHQAKSAPYQPGARTLLLVPAPGDSS